MPVKFEQLFYGRGQFGYGILGASQGGKPFENAVESLCEAIGSPDAFLAWKPFLVSRRFGDYCLMACVQPGAPDSGGRATVFFHVLIALASELTAAGIDAFALFDKGLFRAAVQEHPETLSVEGLPKRPLSARPFQLQFPAVVSVPGPAPDLIRGLLGAESVRRSWATFAFQPISGFDLYALNDRASLPTDVACYDSSGKLLSESKLVDRERGKTMPVSKKSPLLGISLVINAILLGSCALLFMRLLSSQDTHGSSPAPVERSKVAADETLQHQIEELKKTNAQFVVTNAQLEAEVNHLRNDLEQKGKSVAGLVSREEVIRELREKFRVEYHGDKIEIPSTFKNTPFGPKAIPYIRFVSDTILKASLSK